MGQRVPLGLCTALLLAGPVFGDAKLPSTVPADSQLAEPPRSLTLTFNEALTTLTGPASP